MRTDLVSADGCMQVGGQEAVLAVISLCFVGVEELLHGMVRMVVFCQKIPTLWPSSAWHDGQACAPGERK